jgi:hypothetical protein
MQAKRLQAEKLRAEILNRKVIEDRDNWQRVAGALGSAVARNTSPLFALIDQHCQMESRDKARAMTYLDRISRVSRDFVLWSEFPSPPACSRFSEVLELLEGDLDLLGVQLVQDAGFDQLPPLPFTRQTAAFILVSLFQLARMRDETHSPLTVSVETDVGLRVSGGQWNSDGWGTVDSDTDPDAWLALRLFEDPGKGGGSHKFSNGDLILQWKP